MKPCQSSLRGCDRKGAALVIILGMLVLLLGILTAFLTRSAFNRDASSSSANLTSVEMLSSLAVNAVIGNLQQEIKDTARSTAYAPPNGGATLFLPLTPADAMPRLELPGLTATDLIGSGMENLQKVSVNGGLAPTNVASRDGRNIPPARWNKPLLMKRAAADGSDDSPPAEFPIPDWIYVARDGTNPTAVNNETRWNPDASTRETIIGRYAYVVYNQGGLLDANVAGHPASANPATIPGTNITNPARYKTSAGYADLTIPEIGLTQAQVDTLVEEWRNQATLSSVSTAARDFFDLNLKNTTGFLAPANTTAPGGVTDRQFVGRSDLINFFADQLEGRDSELMDSLQYFTTFSHSLIQPTFYRMQGRTAADGAGNPLPNYHNNAPVINSYNSDHTTWNWQWIEFSDRGNTASGDEARINPIFPAITVPSSVSANATRLDGTPLQAGEPLVKKKFPLDRLLWVTYKGPSATLPATDPLITDLETEGITREFLLQGTAENVAAAFGLRWTPGPGANGLGGYWTYDVHSQNDPIDLLESVASQNREPDFFELLKATVDVGAIGRAREGLLARSSADVGGNANPAHVDGILRDSSVNNHIIQLGANLIDQVHPENYPTHIVLPEQDGTIRSRSFWGTVDLPYFYGSTYGPVLAAAPEPALVKAANNLPERGPHLSDITTGIIRNFGISAQTGATILMKFPVLWNPHAQKSSPVPANLTPQRFRICVSYSDIAEPSEIGQETELMDIFRLTSLPGVSGEGSVGFTEENRNLDAFTSEELFRPKYWSRNASGIDAESLGVLRFSDNDPTALIYDIPTGSSLFRRPTPLQRRGFPADLNLRVTGSHRLANMDMDALGTIDYSGGVREVGTNNDYLGFVVGRFPMRWNGVPSLPFDTTTHILQTIWVKHSRKLTYSLEYSTSANSDGPWIPYRQVVVSAAITGSHPGVGGGQNTRDFLYYPAWTVEANPVGQNPNPRRSLVDRWQNVFELQPDREELRSFLDPRTARWGFNGWGKIPRFFGGPATGEFNTFRPDTAIGNDFMAPGTNDLRRDGGAASKTSLMWNPWDDSIVDKIVQSRSRFELPFYDADNVMRRPMGAWVPTTTDQSATSTVGLPLAHGGESGGGANANRFNRPIILHRPFRSVAEMSHTFTDTPYRNIDFFTPESGFTGLLDVFTVSSNQRADSLVAGKVDLNTRQMPVLKALLAGAYRDTLDDANTQNIPASEAEDLAIALINRTTSNDPGRGPLWNVSHLVGRFDPGVDIQAQTPSTRPIRFDGFSSDIGVNPGGSTAAPNVVQRLREAPIRVLSQTGQVGTWNLLVDIVAQTGRLPSTASDLDDFIVESESRVWLHLAIHRLTGKILSQNIEFVSE
jgi:hypothetical protein